MNPPRKRQKTSLACQRCRQRKLGCDQQRPCQLCVRAGAVCVPRGGVPPGQAEPVQEATGSIARRESVVRRDDAEAMLGGEEKRRGKVHDTSALPGGIHSPVSVTTRSVPWWDLAGIPLPPKTALDELMSHFFDSVDWFIMVFHEESFRQRYEKLMASTLVPEGENSNFPWLVLLALGLGAHYGSLAAQGADADSLRQFSSDLLTQIEQRLLAILDLPNLETVQICVLLGSFHLFNGRPTAGLVTLAGGLKIAQVIGLHQESKWRGLSEVSRESRRRSWWALEVADKYAAVAFGRPCTVDDFHCDVASVSDIKTDGHTSRQGPLLEYHQWKFKMYRIMGPFLSRRLQGNRLKSLNAIHTQLSTWKSELPAKLRLETYKDHTNRDSRILAMQALALQLTYDNLQIILHRSAAFGVNESEFLSNEGTSPDRSFSQQQLLESALRTSQLNQHAQLLQACRKTHAVMHIGICLFTSGVVLCAIALAQPLSMASQKAKEGVMRILRLQEDSISSRHLLSVQSVQILRDLVTVVMRSEERAILGESSVPISPVPESSEDGWPRSLLPQAGPIVPDRDFDTGASQSVTTPGPLNPLQQVFRQHLNQSFPTPDPSGLIDPNSTQGPEAMQQPIPSAMFSWDGNVSALADAGLVDASQMWLWSDNLEYQSFSELSSIFP
ncbi:fungal-specific transcription factor domain-containing protein [Aspergillus floccosus]